MEEKELIDRARRGEEDAFAALVDRYRTKMFNLAYSMTRNREEADDMTQDVFVKAWRHISGFQGRSAFGTWLYRIAVNTVRDFMRRESRFPKIEYQDYHAQSRHEEDALHKNEAKAEQERLKDILRRAMRTLPEKYRVILSMRDIQGMPYGEIARILGLSPGTVDSRLFRARKRLRQAVERMPSANGGNHALS